MKKKRGRNALSLTEVLVASLVIVASVPPLIEMGMMVARMDTAQYERAQSRYLAQAVLENIHYKIYNDDCRGYRLGDEFKVRQERYEVSPPGHLQIFQAQAESGRSVVTPVRGGLHSRKQSRFFSGFFNESSGSLSGSGEGTIRLSQRTNPTLAGHLAWYELDVGVTPHLEDLEGRDSELELKNPHRPKVDLARIEVRLNWKDHRGRRFSRSIATRYTRPLYECDPTRSEAGK